MIEVAWREVPPPIRRRLDNVLVSPATEEQEAAIHNLFGLYQGVPEPNNLGLHHDRITLWQSTMERHCDNRAELAAQVRTTLLHEIGHHFGMTEDEVRRAGYGGDLTGLEWLTAEEPAGEDARDPAQGLLVLLLLIPVAGLYVAWRRHLWPDDELLVALLLALAATGALIVFSGPVALLTLLIPGLSIPAGIAVTAYLWWRHRQRTQGAESGSTGAAEP